MKKEKAFIQIKKYNVDNWLTHLKHVLREKSEIKNPKIKVIGDPNIILNQLMPKSRKCQNRYLEVMVSGYDENDTMKIADFLKEYFKRDVLIVNHYDESHFHTHFLIPWIGTDRKSLRLQISDFTAIKENIAKITEQILVKKGQGRRRLSLREYLSLKKEQAQKRIEEMKKMDQFRLNQIQKILDIYGEIELFALHLEKGRFSLGKVSKIEDVNLKQLCALEKKGNGIYFAPTKPKVLFLDDPPISVLEKLPKNSLVVKTSENKYQVHIPLPKEVEVSSEKLQEWQKALVSYFETDKGASNWKHLRRLPGFTNQKYENKPLVKIIENKSSSSITVEDVVSFLEKKIQKQKQIQNQERLKCSLLEERKKKIDKVLKSWKDFYNGDESVADMKYALYLLGKGFSPEEIKSKLLSESEDIYIRKGKYVEYYLDYTIKKAQEFFRELITPNQKINQKIRIS